MKFLKKAAALAVAGLMAASLAACGEEAVWAAKYGDVTIPAGVYIDELITQYSTVVTELGQDVKDPLKQQVDGVPASEKIVSEAKKGLAKFVAVEQKFDEMGLALTEADQASIDENVNFFWQYLKETYQANGISEESYRMAVSNETKMNAIFQAIYGVGGSEEVPESDLRAKFESDVAKVILIPLSFSTSEDAAEKGEADKKTRETIDQYYNELVGGADMEDVYYEARKLASGDDTLEKPEPGTSYTFVNKTGGAYDQEVVDAVFAAELGKPVKVETAETAYLFVRYDVNENPDDFTSRRDTMLMLLKQDEFNERAEQWGEQLTGVEYNDAAFKRYTPEKLKLN